VSVTTAKGMLALKDYDHLEDKAPEGPSLYNKGRGFIEIGKRMNYIRKRS
jgi:hypothetical protein